MWKYLVAFLFIPGVALASGTLTPGAPNDIFHHGYLVTEYSATFVADASGDVTIDDIATGIGGYLKEVRYIAGTETTATVVIYDRSDSNKTDLLGGAGAGMTTGLAAIPLRGGAYGYPDILGGLYVSITGDVSAGTGTLVLVVGY